MRNPASLALSLFAVAATVSAQSNITQRSPLEPHLETKVGSYHTQALREYPSVTYPCAEDRDDARREANREGRPQPPRINTNHGGAMITPSGDNLNGGVSGTAPATGADARDGSSGSSASSSDSGPASGSNILNLGHGIQDAFGAVDNKDQQSPTGTSTQDALSAQQPDAAYKPTPGYAYNYQRMKRMSRAELPRNMSRRDGLELPIMEDDPDSDNSNQDGADGTSQRGSETDGAGPYGGHADSGQVGSSEGGHVYNEPASSE